MSRLINLVGQRFGWLTVIERARNYVSPRGQHCTRWLCACECGARILVHAKSLRYGDTTSCGCVSHRTHGLSKHPLYMLWAGIKQRCTNPRAGGYHNYGGRGISLYPQWVDDPKAFLDYMDTKLGPRPAGYQLDRIDNDGNYEPGNLRWATRKENGNNKRTIAALEAENADLRKQLAGRAP